MTHGSLRMLALLSLLGCGGEENWALGRWEGTTDPLGEWRIDRCEDLALEVPPPVAFETIGPADRSVTWLSFEPLGDLAIPTAMLADGAVAGRVSTQVYVDGVWIRRLAEISIGAPRDGRVRGDVRWTETGEDGTATCILRAPFSAESVAPDEPPDDGERWSLTVDRWPGREVEPGCQHLLGGGAETYLATLEPGPDEHASLEIRGIDERFDGFATDRGPFTLTAELDSEATTGLLGLGGIQGLTGVFDGQPDAEGWLDVGVGDCDVSYPALWMSLDR